MSVPVRRGWLNNNSKHRGHTGSRIVLGKVSMYIFTGVSSEDTHRCHLSHRCDDVWQCTMLLLPTFSGDSIISEKIFGLYFGFSFTFFVRRVDRTHKNCTMCFAHRAMFSFYISIQISKLSGIMSLCLVRRCR